MASETDETRESLIEDLRPRLRELIVVERVLDHVHFIETDQKELIRQKARNEGDTAATELLITAVLKKPHSPGWFRAFVDALQSAGCEYAADWIQADKLPEPEEEAENDYCVRLIQIMSPSLVNMRTDDVCLGCFSKRLITQDDSEKITAEITTKGPMSGARELLRIIVRGRPGWFSQFLQVLQDTEHQNLYNELTGGGMSPDCDKPDKKPPSPKDEPKGSEGVSEAVEINSTEDSETADLYKAESTESKQLPNSQEPSQPGSGKTRVSVYITKKHLDHRRAEGQSGKVIVLVNKVPLVEQHYHTEFGKYLKHKYKVERVSGESQLKISFTEIVKKNDVIICTAQILENYLERSNTGEDEGVNLSELTLIIIDECHHTQKGGVYNHIMMRYLKQKHKNRRLRKEQKEVVPLPQILGLTASPGVGGATKINKAVDHILQICANLDATRIMTGNLGQYKKEPRKATLTIEERKEDPFGHVIKKIMNTIHAHAELNPTFDLDSQHYKQWVVQTRVKATTDEDHKVRVCAEHLQRYNDGLNLSNTIRMRDAFTFLNKSHEEERKKKTQEAEQKIEITPTERFLLELFEENKEELQKLAAIPDYENHSLSKLQSKILQEFSSRGEARGIIFTKTRQSAIALSQWVQENHKFDDIGVKASYVIGGGDQSAVKPMTAAEGRGRAEDSSYTLVEVQNSGVAEKETVNEYRKDMMHKAIEKIRTLKQDEYDKRILESQMQAILEEKLRMKHKQKDLRTEKPSDVKFSCRGCSQYVCSGEDIQVIEDAHRVNVSSEFSELFIRTENTSLQDRLLDCETSVYIACKKCGQRWGSIMVYRSIECPCLHVKHFVVTCRDKKIGKCDRWNELGVKFSPFDYIEHGRRLAESSDDDETTFVTPVNLPTFVQYFAWAPTGHKYVYVSDFNIFLKSDVTAEAVQVTHNGKKNEILNGVPDWVYEEEVFASNGAIWWSTTGKYLAYLELNDTEVNKVEFSWYGSEQYPQTMAIPYPKAGSPLTKVKLFVVDTTNPSRRTQVFAPASVASGDHIMCSVTWVTDERVAVQWLTRKQNYVVVQIYDFDGSSWREVQKFEHTSKTGWVGHYMPLPLFFTEDSLSFFHVMSDTQGYKHIHYVKDGKAEPVTSGKWEVIYISKLTKDAIYYVSNEYQGIPGKRNFYKVMIGSRPFVRKCLTCDVDKDRCQYNSAYLSFDASYYRMDCFGPGLPRYTLVDNRGSGAHLWYQMMLPPNFKKTKKYPLLIDVYAGPCSQRVDYRFKLNWGTYLSSSHGIIFASFDGRGSGYQGDAIMHAIYRRLGTFEVEDQLTAVRKFIDMGFIDKDRIAIWGWSYGGYVTSMALGAGTGLFKCGVAVAPVAKWEYYDAVYTERYMGKPTENTDAYTNSTVTGRVKNFKTVDYLLVHGTADDNVHFQQAAQISKALVDEQVDFETCGTLTRTMVSVDQPSVIITTT
ncbi:hypothetical protein INR49_005345 [Caranx melampygus]|nr:hypothetical protein INR49_005345 [Caranx melampygus]